MPEKTPLHASHVKADATMVDFGGWDMPLHYGSQIEEHHAVRTDSGMFDVSHMSICDLTGPGALALLRYLMANDVAKLSEDGQAIYSCMLNPSGCVLDDLIVYRRGTNRYRVVSNASTRSKVLDWMNAHAEPFEVRIQARRELAMIAVQGPKARERAAKVLFDDEQQAAQALALKPFTSASIGEYFVAHTGYTGEAGWEIILPDQQAAECWQALTEGGLVPCGLGARDTLRLEAGMCLYGTDMDESRTPLEVGLKWTVTMDSDDGRDFIGRQALSEQLARGLEYKQVGLVLSGRGVLRSHQVVHTDAGEGEVTSGTFSPTMGKAIALARVPVKAADAVEVQIRNKRLEARVVRPPFVRHGKVRVALD